MVKNKSIFVILALVVAFILGTAGLTIATFMNIGEEFLTGGYILDPSQDEYVTTDVNNQYYFNAGTKYKNRYDKYVEFKDINGNKVALENNKFIHYLDGSLGALTKGVILEANRGVISDQVIYYGISNKSTLVKNGSTYSMNTLDSAKELSEFIWKLSDDTYMVVAPTVTLHLSDSQEITLDDYAQIEYVKEGIVRIVHQNGTFQTVSSEAYLMLPDDVRLNLTGQYFEVNGVEGVYLSDMIVDNNDNVAVKENNDEVNLPTFNVVNGKDGAPGVSGQAGEDGEIGADGKEGADGADGKNGSNGDAGYEGYDGTDGTQGTDGYEGYTGNTGNQGGNGEGGYQGNDGKDAPNSDQDGIIAVKQLTPPSISLDTSTYKVGSNSVNMDLLINDEFNLLTSDLVLNVIDPKNPNQIVQTITIPRGTTKANLNLNNLSPNTEYYVVISGQYDPDNDGADYLDGQFFVKSFKTDLLGIGLRKDKVTENSVSVAVDFEPNSNIATYSVLAKYVDENGVEQEVPNEASKNVTKDSDETKIYEFINLEPNTEYTFYLANVTLSDATLAAVNDSFTIKTLKRSPYVVENSGAKVPVTASSSVVTANNREQTVSVTMHSAGDPDKGIVKYRYELFETNTTANLNSITPVQTKESNSLEVVTFDVERNVNYVGRVVVIFDDNEKVVELETKAPQAVMINEGNFPIASFSKDSEGNDNLDLTVSIVDSSKMLLEHVNSDYPIRLVFTSVYGDAFEHVIDNPVSADGVTCTLKVNQRGLRNDTVYSISLTGPVYDGETNWNSLNPQQKNKYKNTYISGIQYDTRQHAIIEPIYFDQAGQGSSAFKVAINVKRYESQYTAMDPAYIASENTEDEVKKTYGTLNKMTFELKDPTGKVIGTTSILDKAVSSIDTQSEFYDYGYSTNGVKNSGTTDNLVLSPKSFGVSETMFEGGKEYTISLVSVEDYVGNELKFAKSKADYKVEVKESHRMAEDPYNQVNITEILNANAPSQYQNADLALDAIVGIRVEPKYALGDVLKVNVTAYKLASDTMKPIEETSVITNNNCAEYDLVKIATKEFSLDDGPAKAPTGDSKIGLNQYWTIYFDEELDNGLTEGGKVVFKRGEKYIFKYEITTSKAYKASCYPDNEGSFEVYPYCIYQKSIENGIPGGIANRDDVPFYRSQLYSAKRQAPTVECYPAASDNNSITWMYRIFDPDGTVALAGDSGVRYKQKNTETFEATDLDGANKISCPTVTDKNAAFSPVKLISLTKNYYYQMRVEYKLDSSETTVSTITSDVMQFRNHDRQDRLILNEVIDDGGGEIKFEILGNNIDEYTAVKIIARKNGVDPAIAPSYVFDPVPFAEVHTGESKKQRKGTTTMYNYGYVYIDANVLKNWVGEDIEYTLYGYKDTHAQGLGQFNVISDKITAGTEVELNKFTGGSDNQYYALYDMMNNQYLTFSDFEMGSASGKTDDASGTLIIPGSEKSPFQAVTTADGVEPYLRIQTVDKALVSIDYTEANGNIHEAELPIAFDKNGMYALNNTNSRLSLNTLKLIEFTNKEHQVLNEILPSIQLVSKSAGVKTGKFEFALNGDLEKYNEFYVALYKNLDPNVIDLVGEEVAVGGSTRYYYNAQSTHDGNCTPYRVVTEDNVNGKMEFLLRGLTPSTDYYVQIYAIVDRGGTPTKVNLYDTIYRESGKQYELSTSNNVLIEIKDPVNSLVSAEYSNKYVTFDYKIDGAGMGYTLKYDVYKGSDKVVDGATLSKKGSVEQYKYYDNVFGSNNAGVIHFVPGTSPIKPGESYRIVINAIDDIDQENIGTVSKTFTARSLRRPTSSYSLDETETTITLNYTLSDADHVIIDTTGLSYTVRMYDADGAEINTIVVDGAEYPILSGRTFENLVPNTVYTFVVEANIDVNNDGEPDDNLIIDEFTGKTSPDIDADVTAYVSGGNYKVVIYNTKNFDVVKRVSYTIYGSSGATIGSGTITEADGLSPNGGEYATSIGKSGSGMQYISATFYDETGKLVGSSLNKQFHIE